MGACVPGFFRGAVFNSQTKLRLGDTTRNQKRMVGKGAERRFRAEIRLGDSGVRGPGFDFLIIGSKRPDGAGVPEPGVPPHGSRAGAGGNIIAIIIIIAIVKLIVVVIANVIIIVIVIVIVRVVIINKIK